MSACVICQRLEPERPQACEGCRRSVDALLGELVELYAMLPAVMEPGASTGQRVSGSREAPLPLRVDPLDLTLPLRHVEAVHDPDRLQTGQQPVAARLWWICDDWRQVRDRGERQPDPTVAVMAYWLRDRLQWACDEHPAVDEAASEIREIVSALRRVLGQTPPKPQPCVGVECDRCDLRMLVRRQDGTGDVECGNVDCRRVMRASEYAAWTDRLAAHERGREAA